MTDQYDYEKEPSDMLQKLRDYEVYVRDTPTIKKLTDSLNEFLAFSKGKQGFLKIHHDAAQNTKEIIALMAEYKRRRNEIAEEMKLRLANGVSSSDLLGKIQENDVIDRKINALVEFLSGVGYDLIDWSRGIHDLHEKLKQE